MKEPKINFIVWGKVIESRPLKGFEKGEISFIKKSISKRENVPEEEISTEVED